MPPLSWRWLQVRCNRAAEALPPARNRYFPLDTGLRIHERSSKLVSSWPSLQHWLHRRISWDFTFMVLVLVFCFVFSSPNACHEERRWRRDEIGTTWTFKRGGKKRSLEDVSELCLWDTSCSQPEHGTMSMRIYFDKVYFYSPQGSAWLGTGKRKKSWCRHRS